MTWNINGLLRRKTELSQFLHAESIDTALIAETHLISRLHAESHDYNLFTCNRPNDAAHGGAAIYINKTLVHYEAESYSTAHILAACIVIELDNGTQCKVAAVYSPPKTKIEICEYEIFFQHLGRR